jgi:Ca2+-dependent lipid-binding protein
MPLFKSTKGKMTIKVISAQGYNTSTDAYVKIEVEDGSPSSATTEVISDNPSPQWNQEFTFEVKASKGLVGSHKVWIYVKDKKLMGGKEIGYCEFKYDDDKKFPSGQTVEFRCEQVASRFGKTTATLNLDITVTWDQQ